MTIISKFFKKKTEYYWSPEVFYALLKNQVSTQKENDCKPRILQYLPHKGDIFIIFGDVQGAFHSLIRDLERIKELGFLDSSLKITQERVFIVFNGDLINRSAYVMETMSVVLALESANPGKVLYLRGNHEDKNEWQNHQLEQEILFKRPITYPNDPPVRKLIQAYFNSLPLGLYLTFGNDFVRISHFKSNCNGTKGYTFGALLKQEKEKGKLYSLAVQNHIEEKENILIKVSIAGENHTSFHRLTHGLELLFPDHGSTCWNIMSAPTETFQKLFQFYNDAFVIFQAGDDVYSSILELHYQDVRNLNGFKTKLYHPVYGTEIVSKKPKKVSKEEVVVGCTLDLTKTSSLLGRRIREGMHIGALEANDKNEMSDRFIRLVFLDDGYTPHRARRNAEILKDEYKADLLLSPIGTPTTEAILPLVAEGKTLILFPFTGSKLFRKKELKHFIHFRPSLQKESFEITKFAVSGLDQKRMAFFYQNDGYGLSCLEGARKVLDLFYFDYVEVPYERNSLNIDSAAEAIAQFKPSAIMFFATTAPSMALIKKLGIEFLFDKMFFGTTFMTDALRYFLRSFGLEFIVTRIVPHLNTDLEICKKYKHAIETYSPTKYLSAESFEAYIQTKLLEDLLKNMEGSITKERIIEQFESMENKPFYGLNLNFDQETRELETDLWVDLGKGPWIKLT